MCVSVFKKSPSFENLSIVKAASLHGRIDVARSVVLDFFFFYSADIFLILSLSEDPNLIH